LALVKTGWKDGLRNMESTREMDWEVLTNMMNAIMMGVMAEKRYEKCLTS